MTSDRYPVKPLGRDDGRLYGSYAEYEATRRVEGWDDRGAASPPPHDADEIDDELRAEMDQIKKAEDASP